MTVNGDGRLGNQMFQVASLIGTAFRYNYTPIIPPRYRLLNNSFDFIFRDVLFVKYTIHTIRTQVAKINKHLPFLP
jgi:hypothetical protein